MIKRTFIVAEAGVNHNGNISIAKRLIEAAKMSGADAVKFQMFEASELASLSAPMAPYQTRAIGSVKSQREMLNELELSRSDFAVLKAYADELDIEFMCTAFDANSLEFLVSELEIKRIKIPSGEITNGPLLLEAARHSIPILLSTGMSTLQEIDLALKLIAYGRTESEDPTSVAQFERFDRDLLIPLLSNVTILHCTSAYPTPLVECNLNALVSLRETFVLKVGYSDHTTGLIAAPAAIALGAEIIEKHLTLDRSLVGPDHTASCEPAQFRTLVDIIRETEAALGREEKAISVYEQENRIAARRSLFTNCDVSKGEMFELSTITSHRPGRGISPMLTWDLVGRAADRDYLAGEQIEYPTNFHRDLSLRSD